MNTAVKQNLYDILIDTYNSIESIDSFFTKYSSSSEWQINSASDDSTFTIKKSRPSSVPAKNTQIKTVNRIDILQLKNNISPK